MPRTPPDARPALPGPVPRAVAGAGRDVLLLGRDWIMKIALGHGRFALIDDADYLLVASFSWHAKRDHNWYAAHTPSPTASKVFMHRLIVGAARGQIVDHINGDTLDNRRANLRIVTAHQSAMNRGPHAGSSSRFIGVTLHRQLGKWQASIGRAADFTYLGCFVNESEAARAYDIAAADRYGAFARLNFPKATP